MSIERDTCANSRVVSLSQCGRPFDRPETSGSLLRSYRAGRFRDVTDGLSQALALVERAGKPYSMKDGTLNPTTDNPDALYWSINNNGVNESNQVGIYSFHPKGAYVGVADGSVRFLSDSTDFKTLVKLYGRSDGGIPDSNGGSQ